MGSMQDRDKEKGQQPLDVGGSKSCGPPLPTHSMERFKGISPPSTQSPTFHHHLFSVEQKNCTQGLVLLLSEEGGRYMASEKQVSNSLSSSVLKERNKQ